MTTPLFAAIRLAFAALALVVSCLPAKTQAADPPGCALQCLVCPDSYCSKPLPIVTPFCCRCCDSYCRKPVPCPPCPVAGCGCNAYSRKPFPCPPAAHWSRWLTCPPPACGE